MPIVVQESDATDRVEFSKSVLTLREIFSECPNLLEKSRAFADRPTTEVRESDGVLYVRQKEDAVTFDGDRLQDGHPVRCCGTEDVLTCHVVVLHHPEARVTAIAHFDEYVKEARLKRLYTLHECYYVHFIIVSSTLAALISF